MLDVIFFRTPRGNEPVRVWLSNLGEEGRSREGHRERIYVWLEDEETYQEVGVCHNE